MENIKDVFKRIEEFNLWGDKELQTGFKRDEYLNKIAANIGTRLVKVVIGQRRTGKSYILRQLMSFLVNNEKVNPDNIFYLNKEFTAFDEIKSAPDLEALFLYYKKELNVSGKTYLFLD